LKAARILSVLLVVLSFVPFTKAAARKGESPAADLANALPGRDPNQPIDEAYTQKIREYTTAPYFMSPLVDYLPASKTVPTPAVVLGDIAGAPTKLPYSTEVYDYMRRLAKATPRVRVYSMGKTEEGREMIAVAVASEQLMAKLDENQRNLDQLADPRTIGMDDQKALALIAKTTPVYYITGTIHSPESGAPTAVMELAYRLAVDDSAYIRNIREHVITLITPIVEVDGRDREVDIVRWHFAHPNETYPQLVYWGHYVAHDNNRDGMGLTLKLSQNVLNTYVRWKPLVLHDLHESYPYLYDTTDTDGAYNAWIDPILANEWHMMGWNTVTEMTRFGMPGVYAHGPFDSWSPGYLESIAMLHNGINRLYETFGNGGTPETMERTLTPNDTSRTWWRQDPPLPKAKWSLRNNNNYEQTGLLVNLFFFANNRQEFLQSFWEKSKRSILKAKTEGPAAYILPGDDPRLGTQAELLRVLQRQDVEISRATAPFSVQVPVHKSAAQSRGDSRERVEANAEPADTAAEKKPAEKKPTTETKQFPAGTYIIRMDQPYSRIADSLLDYSYYSPQDPQKIPYDDTGWTFPELYGVKCVRVTDAKVLDVPVERLTAQAISPGRVNGSGNVFAINHNGDNALITHPHPFKDADFQTAEEPFDAAGHKFNRGSFLIRNVSGDELSRAAKELGIDAYALGDAPNVKTHPARAPRIALLHAWTGTQAEGWWRQTFDFLSVPYEYISVQDIPKNDDLRAKYDVIVFPPAGGGAQQLVDGLPMWRNPLPWKKTDITPNIGEWAQTDDIRPGMGWRGIERLHEFVANGGVLITSESTADFATQYGFATGVEIPRSQRIRVVGSVLRSKIVDSTSPIVYGIPDNLGVYSADGQHFAVSNTRGGRFGRFGQGAPGRATGRGTVDDPDVTQGRPEALGIEEPRPTVQAWQATPITDEQLRNPLNVIPPDQRPRVALRFADRNDLLVSGLLDGAEDLAGRPMVVDVPVQKGHVVMLANNPIYRGETAGSYFLVFNTLLNFDNLNAGRKLDAK
jgi:hypothetical protein